MQMQGEHLNWMLVETTLHSQVTRVWVQPLLILGGWACSCIHFDIGFLSLILRIMGQNGSVTPGF